MKTNSNSKFKFKKKWLKIIIPVAVVGLLSFWYFSGQKPKITYTTVDLKRGALVQTVSEVGTLKASKELELNFSVSGKVSKIMAHTGDVVKKDQELIGLDQSSLLIQEQQTTASVAVAKASLNKLISGATSAEIAVAQASVNSANSANLAAISSYEKIKNNIDETILQDQKKLDDLLSDDSLSITSYEQSVISAQLGLDQAKSTYKQAMDGYQTALLTTLDVKIATANSALDYVNRILTDDTLKDVLSAENMTYLNNTKSDYALALALLVPARSDLAAALASPSSANIDKSVDSTLAFLNKTYKTISDCFSALENTITSSILSVTQLEAFKTNVSAHQVAVNTAVAGVQTADYNYTNSILTYNTQVSSAENTLSSAKVALTNAIKTARDTLALAKTTGDQQLATASAQVDSTKRAWELAQKQLAELKTPARSEDISLANAQLAQAQANLDLIKKQESDNVIKAPIDGQISQVNYEIGEQTSAAKSAVTMLTENNFEIEVDISESDISKVGLQNVATITFDAFGETRKFNGVVYFVDPASTVISGVTYYKVKVKLTDAAETITDLKAGMTANVTIDTARRDNVLIAPTRAVIERTGDGKYVRVLESDGTTVREVSVSTGLSGGEGMIEVISDELREGDKVVTYIKTN
jgi:HlyD family secretion protein